MLILRTLVAALMVVGSAWLSAEEADKWPLRWRVCADYEAGYTFRFPYDFQPPHQYKTELKRGFSARSSNAEVVEITVGGKKIKALVQNDDMMREIDVKAFSFKADQLPSDLPAITLEAVGNYSAQDARLGFKKEERALAWTAYDYYQNPEVRPFADAKWATPGIEASIGETKGSCGIVIKHGDRYSGIICAGPLSNENNRTIIDTFEILAMPKGAKVVRSWRESQTYQNKVLDHEGKPVPGSPAKPVGWKSAWECETRHYHVTSHVSPKRLLEYGAFCEALYAMYASTYKPDSMPPYKMEIHIFNTQSDFMTAAGSKGFPVGPSVGGFFVPSQLCIYAFEDTKGARFSADFTLEKVVAHECSHQFLHVTCNGSDHVPTWINEGLAVYFESAQYQPASKDFKLQLPRQRIAVLKSYYGQQKNTMWPMDNYLTHYGHISGEQYGEVYAMVHFWIFGANGGLTRFKDYWQALKNGENGSDAFERVFMTDLIKAHRSRDKALEVWQQMMLDYVTKKLP